MLNDHGPSSFFYAWPILIFTLLSTGKQGDNVLGRFLPACQSVRLYPHDSMFGAKDSHLGLFHLKSSGGDGLEKIRFKIWFKNKMQNCVMGHNQIRSYHPSYVNHYISIQ